MIGKLIDLAEYTGGTIAIFNQEASIAVIQYENEFVTYIFEDDNWRLDK